MRKLIMIIAVITSGLVGCESTRMVSAERFSKNSVSDYKTFGFAELSKKVKVNRVDTKKTREFLRVAILDLMEEKATCMQKKIQICWWIWT